jgi:hypothetical protein
MPPSTSEVKRVCARIPTLSHIPRKFTRPSHLGSAVAPNRSFSSPESVSRVGSIPIARSTSRRASRPVGTRDWGQHVDPVGKRWERTSIWRRSRVLRCPYAAPAFARTVTRGDFKNNLCDSHTLRRGDSDRGWLESTLRGPSRDVFRMSAIAVLRSCCHQRTRDDPISAQRNPPLRGSVLLPDVVHIPALIANAAELDRLHCAEMRHGRR